MSTQRSINNLTFWTSLLIVIIAILTVYATFTGWFRLSTVIMGESIHHWFSFIGTGFIAIYLPVYSMLKRRYPSQLKTLLPIHVFGNLLAFVLLSAHFSHHLTRPSQAYPDLGTGIALYAAVLILIITGFVLRFHLTTRGWKSWRWVHTGVMLSFYLVIILHVLHGLEVI
jgi:hypothetical protein